MREQLAIKEKKELAAAADDAGEASASVEDSE